ncbi:EAL domain-containing protein [Alicyclobacillus fodiniaquatilis]|uniref:EAL domain-containing protein n=1 Tax=Alicyclobacillus fodiniaquatilis TaxID=1661150 RepID=A0ABW4JPQ0_9BACL
MKSHKRIKQVKVAHQSRVDSFYMEKWTIDLVRGELHCSAGIYQLFDTYRSESREVPGLLVEWVHPEDKSLVEMLWNQILHGNRVVKCFTCRILQGHQLKFFQYHMRYQYDEHGVVVGIEGTVRDVTDVMTRDNRFKLLKSNQFVDWNTEAIVIVDRDHNVTRCSSKAERLFGWTKRELLIHQAPFLQGKDFIIEMSKTLLQSGGVICLDASHLRKNGTTIDVNICMSVLRDANHEIIGVVYLYKENKAPTAISDWVLANDGGFSEFVLNSSDVFVFLSHDCSIQYISPAVQNVLGYQKNALLNTDFLDLIHPKDKKTFQLCIERVGEGIEKVTKEMKIQHHDHHWRICQTKFKFPQAGSGLDGIVINFHDATEKKEAEELVHYVTRHDHLTHLPNQKTFKNRLAQQIAEMPRNSVLAVMTLCLRQFKDIHHTFGASISEELLFTVANHIRGHIPSEYLVARASDDEFSIMIRPFAGKDNVFALAGEIVQSFEPSFSINQYHLFVPINIGISFYPDDGVNAETLIRNADLALHRAKQRGYNTLQAYTSRLDMGTCRNFALANGMGRALKNSEFALHYQPRVDTITGKMIAAEALIRWAHPQWGFVSPAEFIPIAESSGLIVPIGEWVLREACSQLRKWREAGLPEIKVSVNISVKQFLTHDFVDTVQYILRQFQIDPLFIEFEITETAILPDDPAIAEAIKQFRDMGISIYFDDFGTGYSSLSWLQRLDLDGIKLDKSFVDHIPHNWAPTQIVASVIQLAHRLNITVVAEGVETEQQLAYLKENECDEFQGYLYSRALPASAFEELLWMEGRGQATKINLDGWR